MDGRIKAYEDENSPAAVRKRSAEMSTKDLYPSATIGTQALLAAGGLGASMAMKGRAVGRYNSSMDDMSAGLTSANAAGRTAEASALTARLNDMIKKGPSSAGTVSPTVAGFELGAFAPTFGDYYRSGGDPSSPLYRKAMGSMTGVTNVKALGFDIPIPDLATRIGMAGLAGVGASKIGNRAVESARGLRNAPDTAVVQAEVNGRNINNVIDAFYQQHGKFPTQAEFAKFSARYTLPIPVAAGAAAGPVNDMLNYYQGQ